MRAARGMIRALARAARDAEATNATALVDTSMMTTATSLRVYASAASAQPLLVTMIGVHKPLNEVHRKIEAAGAEIKESRNVRLGGRSSNMFLVANADAMAIKKQFEGEAFDFFSVYPARNTVQDLKGPYCETSPLLPFVRRATMSVPYKVDIVNEITDFLCGKGITLTHMDEYRSGKDVVLECICLLYTSPSPRDKRQSRMPSSA